MTKSKYCHSISLDEKQEKELQGIMDKGVSLINVFRVGLEAIKEDMKGKNGSR